MEKRSEIYRKWSQQRFTKIPPSQIIFGRNLMMRKPFLSTPNEFVLMDQLHLSAGSKISVLDLCAILAPVFGRKG